MAPIISRSRTGRIRRASAWTITGAGGAELSFRSSFTDKFGDLFGMMYLTLPKNAFAPGFPLTFRVVGEDAGSPEWFMVFEYAFNFTPRVRVEPAALKSGAGAAVPLRVGLDNLVPGRRVTIADGDTRLVDTSLDVGGNIFVIPVAGDGRERKLVYRLNGKEVSADRFAARPAAPLEIFLIPHSHTDIGYTDLQPDVEKKHWKNIDVALDLIRRTKDYPEGSRFRWNIEVLWPFETYLANATPERRLEVIDAVRSGSIGLNALLVNPLTGLAGSPGMDRYTEYARRLTAEYAIDIPTAAVSDIPGFTWGIVSSLARSGVRYFASAPNPGDRTGYVLEKHGDRPFFWESQSGTERVLFWVAGSSYALFHEGTLSHLGREKLMKLLRRIGSSGYPYDMYYLPYTLGDNGGPDTNLPAFVKRWNEEYETPKLVIATHREMFETFERRYGKELPVKRGDFTPYWEDGAVSTARETGLNRGVADRLVQGEAVWAMRSPDRYPAEEYSEAWKKVSLWDEHTWGADISVSSPDSAKTTGQWEIKRRYVADSDSMSSALLARGLDAAARGDGAAAVGGAPGSVAVYNTSSWTRTDIVYLSAEQSRAGDGVVDGTGAAPASQRLTTGELAVLVEAIAPFSSRTLTVRPGPARAASDRPGGGDAASSRAGDDVPGGGAGISGGRLFNARLSVAVDSTTGAITEIVSGGRRFRAGATGLNRFVYVPGTNPDSALYLSNVRVRVGERGPLVASYVVEGDAPGCRTYSSEIRVLSGIDRVDLVTTVDKLPIREKEGVHIAFPFAIDGATFRYDVAGSIVEPGKDQLDGSCMNFFSVQGWADVSGDSSGVTWTSADAPLVETGGINAESPWMKSPRRSPEFFSYVMNNYWHTNYKADQEGVVSFRYGLHPHGPFDPAEAVRWGRERRAPLICASTGGGEPVPPLFTLRPSNVVVESVEPAGGPDAFLLLLYNPSGSPASGSLDGRDGNRLRVAPCDPSGKPTGTAADEITLAPHESQYVLTGRKSK